MPTAGRLFGAVTFALLGFAIAVYTAPIFEEGRLPSYWFVLGVAAGLWAGWVVVGKRAGNGDSISNGLTGGAALVFWVLFVTGFLIMIEKSMRGAYSGPVEAVVNVAQEMYDLALGLYSPTLIGIILGGSVLAGLVTGFFGKRLP